MAGDASAVGPEPSIEPLGQAFRRLFFLHPEIDQLREEVARLDISLKDRARSISQFRERWPLNRTYNLLAGHYGALHEDGGPYWPVIANEELEEELSHLLSRSPARRRTVAEMKAILALDLVLGCFNNVMGPLKTGSVLARGHTLTGDLVELSTGVWTGDLCIDIDSGSLGIPDLSAIKKRAEELASQPLSFLLETIPPDPFTARFQSIEIIWHSHPISRNSKHRKKKPASKSDSVIQVIQNLRARGMIAEFEASKQLLNEINTQLRLAGKPGVHISTLKRSLEAIKSESSS